MKKKVTTKRILDELRILRAQINDLQLGMKTLSDKVQPGPLMLPPAFVLKAARDATNETHKWKDCLRVLSSWYGIPEPYESISPDLVPKDAVACYYPDEGKICWKRNPVGEHTVLHEFAHHLCNHKLKIGGETEQKFADQFANEVMKVWNEP